MSDDGRLRRAMFRSTVWATLFLVLAVVVPSRYGSAEFDLGWALVGAAIFLVGGVGAIVIFERQAK